MCCDRLEAFCENYSALKSSSSQKNIFSFKIYRMSHKKSVPKLARASGIDDERKSLRARRPGKNTLPSLLAAAGHVIDEQGYEGLSTTAIAQRAGASTATVYRHFPDKKAVLHALVIHLQTERAASLTKIYDQLSTAPDWRKLLATATRTAWQLRQKQPGGRGCRRALQTAPELWAWDNQQNKEIAVVLAASMRKRKPKLSAVKAQRIALVTLHAMTSLLDLADIEGDQGPTFIEEAIQMRAAYLAPYLD